jgi:hypothetical protein
MFNRVDYQIVSIEIEKIWWKALSEDGDLFEAYYQVVEFIEACGWDQKSFDAETLKRVDANWDISPPSN